MSSYLAGVKNDLKGIFEEAFEAAWKDVVEPALKESYRNGVKAGKTGGEDAGENGPTPPGRRNRFMKDRRRDEGKEVEP